MKYLLLLLMLIACTAHGSTYYVRKDGAAGCNGTVDAPAAAPSLIAGKPGKSNIPLCAFLSPMQGFPAKTYDGDAHPVLHSGDTLAIGAGKFPVGWIHAHPIPGSGNCNDGIWFACEMELGGLSDITIVGAGNAKTQVYAVSGGNVIDAKNTTRLKISGIDFWGGGKCALNSGAPASHRCVGGDGTIWGQNFLGGFPITDVTLDHDYIHGFANNGLNIGAINGLDIEYTRIMFNVHGGIDEDSCGGSKNPICASPLGSLQKIAHSEIGWNGCTEDANRYCPSQNQGGYGDGYGTGPTGGDVLVTDTLIHDNTQDGWDDLYHENGGQITIDHVTAWGNGGNQLKVMGNALIEWTTVQGNCMQNWVISPQNNSTTFPVPPMVMRYGSASDIACRANGDAIAASPRGGSKLELSHVTEVTGSGGMLSISEQNPGDSAGSSADAHDSIWEGNNNYQFDEYVTTHDLLNLVTVYGFFLISGHTPVTFENDIFHGLKDNFCPTPIGNQCGVDPMLQGPSPVKFNPTLKTGSPAIGKGTHCPQSPTPGPAKACNIGAK